MSPARPRRRAALAALVVGLLLAGFAPPALAGPPIDKQALVLLRILAYDKELARRAGDKIVVAIVRGEGTAARAASKAIHDAVATQARRITVAGLAITVVELPYGEGLATRLDELGVSAIYLTEGLGGQLAEIARASDAAGALSFTAETSYLKRGVSIGFGLDQKNSRIRILIDLIQAKAEGAKLSTELLRLAEVVKR